MKEYIIELLSKLGLGINGVMPKNVNIYAGRLQSFTSTFGVYPQRETSNKATFQVSNGTITFFIEVTFTESRQIIKIEIN